MGYLHKNVQLMLEFLEGPFLVLLFLIYIYELCDVMTIYDYFIVILLSMLMILLYTLNVIRHLIGGNN